MTPKEQIRTLLATSGPSFLYYLFDAVVSALAAWLLPDGINALAELLNISLRVSVSIESRAAAFFCTFLFLYGLEVTRWARDVITELAADLPRQITATAVEASAQSIDTSLSKSIVGMLLASAKTDAAAAHRHLQIMSSYAESLHAIPPWLHAVSVRLSQRHLDQWQTEVISLQHSGLMLDLEDQMYIVQSMAELCREYVLVDPVIYRDVHTDWTPAWRKFLNWVRDQNHISRHYIITPEGIPPSAQSDGALDKLAAYLERHGFSVWICEQKLIRDVNPDTPFLSTLFHFYDSRLYVGMKSQPTFTGAQKVSTTVGRVESQLDKYLNNLKQYRRQVVPREKRSGAELLAPRRLSEKQETS